MNESAPETGPAIAVVRSLADFQPRHAAEAKVVAGLGTGDFNRIGNGLCPEGSDPARTVRAELLRLLILGDGDDFRFHEKGLRLSGAEVTGTLGSRSRIARLDPINPVPPVISTVATIGLLRTNDSECSLFAPQPTRQMVGGAQTTSHRGVGGDVIQRTNRTHLTT